MRASTGQLELLAKEGPVKERAHDIRGKIRACVGALHGVNEIEGVEVADEGENADNADGGQDEREFDAPERLPGGGAIHPGGFH